MTTKQCCQLSMIAKNDYNDCQRLVGDSNTNLLQPKNLELDITSTKTINGSDGPVPHPPARIPLKRCGSLPQDPHSAKWDSHRGAKLPGLKNTQNGWPKGFHLIFFDHVLQKQMGTSLPYGQLPNHCRLHGFIWVPVAPRLVGDHLVGRLSPRSPMWLSSKVAAMC